MLKLEQRGETGHIKPLQGSNIYLICKKEPRLHALEERYFEDCVLFYQKNGPCKPDCVNPHIL